MWSVYLICSPQSFLPGLYPCLCYNFPTNQQVWRLVLMCPLLHTIFFPVGHVGHIGLLCMFPMQIHLYCSDRITHFLEYFKLSTLFS